MRTRLLFGLAVTLLPAIASAHFNLMEPPPSAVQSTTGDPQISAPCGPNGPGTPTGAVTTVMAGSTMTLTIKETITHYGHYRVAIAQDATGLPDDPPVTVGTSECGSAPIEPNPTLPLLADGVFLHSSAFSGPQTVQIPIPAGMTCDNCVVQILEFMTNHDAPCFYYHCATVNVIAGPVPDAGATGGGNDAGTDPVDDPGGCCDSGRHRSPVGSLLAVMLVGGLLVRRRAARR